MPMVRKICLITLEVFDKYTQHTEFVLVQGDVGANVFVINILYKGAPYDLTNTQTTITLKKADGNVVVGSPVIKDASKGKIEYLLGTQEVACVGEVIATVEIYDTVNNRLTTSQFSVEVKEQLDNGEAIQSSSEYPIVSKLLGAAAQEDTRVNNENTRISNENTRISNENTRKTNETNRATAETNRSTAETNRVSAENTRVSQENTRKSNETARGTAETNRSNAESARVSAENTRASNETTRQSQEATRQTNTSNAITNLNNAVDSTKNIYKVPVATYSAIATYISPSIGWRVECTDTKKIYRYNGSTWEYIGDGGIGFTAENVVNKGAANGYASLGSDGKVPSVQLPSLNYIAIGDKGVANGVATLGTDGLVPSTQLPALQGQITGGASTITTTNLTVSRALVSDASGKVAVSAVTSIQLGYLSGVTSAIQTQLNGKAASTHNHDTVYAPITHYHNVDYVLKAGDTLTGALNMIANQYYADAVSTGKFGLHMKNSDIVGINALVWGDDCNAPNEGLMFPKTGLGGSLVTTDYDVVKALDGQLFLNSLRVLTTNDEANYAPSSHVNVLATTTTSGHVTIGDGIAVTAAGVISADVGTGLTLTGTSPSKKIAVSFAGSGTATTVSRSDHTHSYLPLAGGTLTGNIKLAASGEIQSSYNSSYLIKDHNNGHVTLSAAGGDLYVGYTNTIKVRLYTDLYAVDGTTPIISETGLGRIGIPVAQTNWLNHTTTAFTDAAIYSRTGTEDGWLYCDKANAQWGIYHRQADTDLSNSGYATLPANSLGFIGSNTLNAYISLANGRIFSQSGVQVGLPYGDCGIYVGNADNCTFSSYNLKIKSWWGIGFESYDNVTRVTIDTRNGNIDTFGCVHGGGGNGAAFQVGDDITIHDVNISNAMALRGVGDSNYAKLILGNSNGNYVDSNSQGLAFRGEGYVDFRNGATSGTYLTMNLGYSGSKGSEPTLSPWGTYYDLYGQLGMADHRYYRMYAGAFNTSSDKALKENIISYNIYEAYDLMKQLTFYTYTYIEKNQFDFKLGTMAQDVPYIVSDVDNDGNETMNIDVYSYASLLGAASQVIQQKVETIEAENIELKSTIEKILSRLTALEA